MPRQITVTIRNSQSESEPDSGLEVLVVSPDYREGEPGIDLQPQDMRGRTFEQEVTFDPENTHLIIRHKHTETPAEAAPSPMVDEPAPAE